MTASNEARGVDSAGNAEAVIDVYWRAGCPFCMRLRHALKRDGITARWHDIWADADAAAFVRSVAGGNETVPTVVLAGTAYVNPRPGELRRMVAERYPAAVAGTTTKRGGWWRRLFATTARPE